MTDPWDWYIYLPAPSNGRCSLNPKGLLNGTLSHPFGTPWRVQVHVLSKKSQPCHVGRYNDRPRDPSRIMISWDSVGLLWEVARALKISQNHQQESWNWTKSEAVPAIPDKVTACRTCYPRVYVVKLMELLARRVMGISTYIYMIYIDIWYVIYIYMCVMCF